MKSLFYGLQNWYGCALQDTLAAHHTGTPRELYWSCWWAERQDDPPHNPTSTSTERKRERDRARERTQYKLVYGQRAACINLLYTRYTSKPIYGQYMTCVRLRAGLYTGIRALLTAGVRLAYGQSEQSVRPSYGECRMHLRYCQSTPIQPIYVQYVLNIRR